MTRHGLIGLLALALAGCSLQQVVPTSNPIDATTSPHASPPTVEPTPRVAPSGFTVVGPAGMPTIAIPAGLEDVAWSSLRIEVDATFESIATHVSAGRLGATASIMQTIPSSAGQVVARTAGDVVAIVTRGETSAVVDVRRIGDGAGLGRVELPTLAMDELALDPGRAFAYAAVAREGGGVEIQRLTFDGRARTTLLTLDKRFTPAGFPHERYVFTLAPNGTLVVLACGAADGCRLWRIAPTDALAKGPLSLAASTPIVCSLVDASNAWLIVYDDDTCIGDTGDSAMPMRAISLRDGSSRLLGTEHILAGRVIGDETHAQVIVSVRSADWSTSDIVGIDLATGRRRTFVHGLANAADGMSGWLGVSHRMLVDPWVLIGPWGGDLVLGTNPPDARLLNVATNELVELGPGSFGTD